jgi:glycolate oxidase FAD binding subunit
MGANQHQHLGTLAHPDSLMVQMTALNHILEYAPADLTITAESGTLLADIQAALHANGQWLPWNPPAGATATIGGLLAAGRSGPLRLGYGTPRDWLLGAHVALGDGRLVKSGGKVVKNVAGYDAHKLHLGALGTLGIILSVTFKIAPLPEADETALGWYPDISGALTAATRLRERPLAPVSIAIVTGSAVQAFRAGAAATEVALLARFMGIRAAVDRHQQVAQSVAAAPTEDGNRFWQQIAEFATPIIPTITTPAELILRIGTRPAAVAELLQALQQHGPHEASVLAEPGVGLAYTRWPLRDDSAVRLAALRTAVAAYDGYVVVEYAPPEMHAALDVWGRVPATIDIMRSLKAKWDPANILNPGRYVGGM